MSDRIETTHRGYKIQYGENNDEWWCHELDITSKSLQRVKRRIDQIQLKERKESAVECFELTSSHTAGGRTKLSYAKVIEYGGAKKPYGYKEGDPLQQEVYALTRNRDSDRMRRSKFNMDNMIRKESGVMDTLGCIHILEAQRYDLDQEIKALVKSLPRLTLDDIEPLVRISTEEAEDNG
jgi:hypothetical protein